MRLAIATTMRCNAACEHCCTSCGPSRQESVPLTELKRIILEAASVPGPSPFQIDLTGGEPFLDFELLVETVAYGRDLGAFMTCMTNGYWAASADAAKSKLQILKERGLHSLGVSTSRHHLRFVPLRRVRQALESARSLGLKTELKVAVMQGDHDTGGLIDECRKQLAADFISIFPVLPHQREGAPPLPADGHYRLPGLPETPCPGQVMMMEPGGTAYACCSAGSSNRFLTLGKVGADSLDQLDSRHRRSTRLRVLRQEGPIHFAREAIRRGEGARLRPSYAGACDLCLHIATDPVLAEIAEQACLERELADLRKAWNLDEEVTGPLTVS